MESNQLCFMTPDEVQCFRESDKTWINKWLYNRSVHHHHHHHQKFDSAVKVSDLQDLFQGILGGLHQVEQLLQHLGSNLNILPSSEWDREWKDLTEKQKDLSQLLLIFEDEDQVKSLLQSVQKVKRKRLRKKKHLSEVRERRKMQTTRLNDKIDAWRAGIIQQEEKKKRDKEFQAEADGVLSEITTKKTEVQRLQKLVAALSKLHKVRRDSAMHHTAQEGDEQFNKIIASLQDLLTNRLKDYIAEERALRVMLEGQEEERRERGRSDAESKFNQLLFGDCKLSATNPVYPFFSLFNAASQDLDIFVRCRNNWDQYISREGSIIPVGWVLPSMPSSASWAAAVQDMGENSTTTQNETC